MHMIRRWPLPYICIWSWLFQQDWFLCWRCGNLLMFKIIFTEFRNLLVGSFFLNLLTTSTWISSQMRFLQWILQMWCSPCEPQLDVRLLKQLTKVFLFVLLFRNYTDKVLRKPSRKAISSLWMQSLSNLLRPPGTSSVMWVTHALPYICAYDWCTGIKHNVRDVLVVT